MGRISVEANAIDRVLRWGTATGEPDDLLLARFLAYRDEGAFAALVDRHGPMVLGVCRRILRDGRDVEDAFQATFLILARRGGTIRHRERVGPWIHGVAHRVAVRARAVSARRFVREGTGLDAEPPIDDPPGREAERLELRSILDEELGRLPGRLRDPLVLCHLQGLTHDQAAAALRQPVGTIRSRLSRGRDRLRARLARRGVSADDARTASVLVAHPVSTALLESTLRSALAYTSTPTAALASAGAALLAQGALDVMFTTKAKLAAVALGTMLTLGGATGYALQQGNGEPGRQAATNVASPPTLPFEEPPQPAPKAEFDKIAFEASLRNYLERLEEALRERTRELKSAEFRRDQLKAEHDSMLENRSIARKRLEELTQAAGSDTPEATRRGASKPAGPANAAASVREAEVRRQILELVEKNKDVLRGPGFESILIDLTEEKSTIAPPMQAPEEASPPRRKGVRTDRDPANPPTQPAPKMVPFNGAYQDGKRLYQDTPKMIIVSSKDGHVVTGYSSETGESRTIQLAPEGGAAIQVTPVLGMSMAALDLRGDAVDRVAIFSSTDGQWHPHDLVEPTKQALPLMSSAAAAYKIGRRIYAFSFVANKWDVLELPSEGPEQPHMNPETITVQRDGRLHVFSAKVGKWTSIDVSDAAEVPLPKFRMNF